MKKILITAVGGDIGYGVIKALKKGGHNLYIIGCDIKKYNISYDIVDDFVICPPYGKEQQWTDFILNLINDKGVECFWPITESEIKIVDSRRELFKNVTLIMNNSNVLNVSMDKGMTARFLTDGGVRTPKTWDAVPSRELVFPLIVKERFGCGSHSVYKVNNGKEFSDAIEEMESPIVQEYIGTEKEEYTLTIFSDGHVINHIAFRRELGFGGMSRYVELIDNEKLSAIAMKIAKLFNLIGSINVQLRKRQGEFYVFEINPRISSTIGFRMLLGFNDVSWWIDAFEGIPITHYGLPQGKVYGARTVEEKIFRE